MPRQPSSIDDLLQQWPYEPNALCVRMARGDDGREVIQMRVDLGVLQIETEGRPDGARPFGADSILDLLRRESRSKDDFALDGEMCGEIDREFIQYYHRRICWLKLQDFERAVEDADHTLALMDMCMELSQDANWTMSHEQYRPFVMFHRTQAAALAALDDAGPDLAVEVVEQGLTQLFNLYALNHDEERFEGDELVMRLNELRDALVERFDERGRLDRELQIAIEKENYEKAARIRDQLAGLPE